jgi:hypothetical protein
MKTLYLLAPILVYFDVWPAKAPTKNSRTEGDFRTKSGLEILTSHTEIAVPD